MRIEFDSRTPVEEQLKLSNQRRKVGRKHEHKGSNRVQQKKMNSKARNTQLKNDQFHLKKQLIRKYWAGEIEEFPS